MGKLVLVGMPLGNASDLSKRGLTTLNSAQIILAEDTRNIKSLMNHLGISLVGKEFRSFHDHSSDGDLEKLIQNIKKDQRDFIYVSDAGSPIISDPAHPLIKRCLEMAIPVETIPGPTSFITALEVSGLPPHPLHFYGFFPKEKNKKQHLENLILQNSGVHIFFESPHRIIETIDYLSEKFPHEDFVVTRELTKKFETTHRFKGNNWVNEKTKVKAQGEFVFLVYRSRKEIDARTTSTFEAELQTMALDVLNNGAKPKLISNLIAKILKDDKKKVYQALFQD